MATATKKQAKPLTSVLETMTRNMDDCFDAAEQVLMQAAAEQRDAFTPQELAILRLAGYDTGNIYSLRGPLGRAMRVTEMMQQAGTNERYDNAKKAAAEAAEREALLRPEIEEQIAQLQAKLNGIEAPRLKAEAELSEIETARQHLQHDSNLPPHILAQIQNASGALQRNLWGKVSALETELSRLDTLIGLNVRNPDDCDIAMAYIDNHGLTHLTACFSSNGYRVIDENKWASHVTYLRSQRKAVAADLETAREPFAKAVAETERLRNFYVDQLN